MSNDEPIVICNYEDKFAQDFARLNREWLDAFALYEEEDGAQLYSPRETILEPGGEIYIAVKGAKVVGTCALMRLSPSLFEVAKLTVSQDTRGKGLGRRLTYFAIDRARRRGAARVGLLSSTKLEKALRLYESIGFKRKPLPTDQPYITADIYMEIDLEDNVATNTVGMENDKCLSSHTTEAVSLRVNVETFAS